MKNILFAVLMPFLVKGVFCQDRFKVGLIGGTISSQVQGDTYAGFNKFGFAAGGFVNTSINQSWSLEMNIMYVQKGSRKNARPDKGDYNTYLMRLHCIEVPLLLKYHYHKFIFEGGLSGANLVKSRETYNEVVSLNAGFNVFELSGIVGLSYQLREKLMPFLKFSNSITPIRGVPGGTNYFNNGQYNTWIFIGIHYTIND